MKKGEKDKRIIIFGFSGSGKSTIANMVGKKTGLRVVHSSGILRDLYANKKSDLTKTRFSRGFWETEKGAAFLKNRLKEDKPLDLILDRILLEELDKNNIVVDCWSMPWLYKKGMKIYLKTSLKKRAERVSKRGKISVPQARKMIRTKDEDTRWLIKKFYNIDIKKRVNIFDLIVNTNNLNKREVVDRIIEYINNTT